MEDRDSGSLSQKALLDLILELHANGVTGSLKLERAPLQKAVYFRDGQILFAASNDPKDQLASILVEEGKLGPDQMQVAQARVSPGNPLAKVLTELGYISQHELADAARVKVERILTDLYTWKEGTYQFATKSLPKGAIDLELSTPRLLFASIRRIQDREWVLQQLGSLETVLSPTSSLEAFITEASPGPQAIEVLRLADGVKSVKQIGAVSSLGEFDVCKILAGGLVVGALEQGAEGAFAVSEDAFSLPSEEPAIFVPPIDDAATGNETLGLSTAPPPPPEPQSAFGTESAAPFEAPSEYEKTIFEPASGDQMLGETSESQSSATSRGAGASDLIIDEPEPDLELPARTPLRPKGKRGGGGGSRDVSGILKLVAVALLVAGAVYSVYYFVWPLVGGGGSASTSTPVASAPPPDSAAPSAAPPPAPSTTPTAAAPTPNDPRATGGAASAPPPPSVTPPPASDSPQPPLADVTPAAPRATSPSPSTSTAPPSNPRPAPAPSSVGGAGGRALLMDGDYSGAANAFLTELRASGSDKFTIAVGLYCNEDNVGRIVESARDKSQLYVLPTTVQGRRCYRVVWGLFDSRESAAGAMPSLPSAVRAGDAATMPLSQFLR